MNVNVTLLFSVAQYERVMEAYIRGLERRQEEGKSLDRHSVASFFVSRVDSEVDKRLDAIENTELKGRAGLANARAAYAAYQRVFEGERFAALREAGAPVQRPLWASTGVKNPAYPTTLYVWGLVAPNTVNTMPAPTLDAARNEGGVSGATAAEDPTADLQALADAGIDLDDVTAQLLREGIDAFKVADAEAAGRDRDQARGDRRVRHVALGQLQVVRGQELLVGEQVERGLVGDDAARAQQHRPLAQPRRERQVVGDDQQRAVQTLEQLHQLASRPRVEVRARLVEHEHARLHRQHGRDRHAALLAQAELMRRAVGVLAHPDRFQAPPRRGRARPPAPG